MTLHWMRVEPGLWAAGPYAVRRSAKRPGATWRITKNEASWRPARTLREAKIACADDYAAQQVAELALRREAAQVDAVESAKRWAHVRPTPPGTLVGDLTPDQLDELADMADLLRIALRHAQEAPAELGPRFRIAKHLRTLIAAIAIREAS
jgi:hypothetical protein